MTALIHGSIRAGTRRPRLRLRLCSGEDHPLRERAGRVFVTHHPAVVGARYFLSAQSAERRVDRRKARTFQ